MSKKLSIAEVRRRLYVGAVFSAQTLILQTPSSCRTVIAQTPYQMKSRLDNGTMVYLEWKGVTARETGNSIILSNKTLGDFLEIMPRN